MYNTGSHSSFRKTAAKDLSQADSRFFQSLRPSVADSDMPCLTNQLLLNIACKPKTASNARSVFAQSESMGTLKRLSRNVTTAGDIQRLLESRNVSVREAMTAAKNQSRDEANQQSRPQTTVLTRTARSSSDFKRSKRVIRGLTASAKPTLILSKELRNNPLTKMQKIEADKLEKHGLLGMVNAGHIPRSVDLKRAFNEIRRPQTSIATGVQSSTMSSAAKSTNNLVEVNNVALNTFLTVAIPHQDLLESPTHSSHANFRRVATRVVKNTRQESDLQSIVQRMKVSPEVRFLTLLNYQVQHDDSFWLFRRECLNRNEWSEFLHFERLICAFARKYKIRKLEFLPKFKCGLQRLSESDIVASLKDNATMARIIRQLHSSSQEFEEHRQEQFRSVMLMIAAKWRFRKTLSQVKYINTIKSLYRVHRCHEQAKYQMTLTLNFKYELFADNQRLMMEEKRPEESRGVVEIHLNTIALKRDSRDSYYKYHERLNAQITRVFAGVRNPNAEVVYISPFYEMSAKIEEYYHRMLKIRGDCEPPTVHFFYLEKMTEQLGRRVNTDDNFFYGLNGERLATLKGLLKGKQAYIVPGEMTRTLVKLCYALDMPCYGSTFTKQSLELLFNREDLESDERLINHVFEFVRFRPLLRVTTEDELYSHLRRQFQEKKQAYFLDQKIARMEFTDARYDRSVVGCRKLFKALGLPVPLALDAFTPEHFYEDLGRMMLLHRDRTLWLLKMDGQNSSRGLAFLETDSIKVINEARKKGLTTRQAIEEVAAILKLIVKQKLRLAHASLYTSDEYMGAFLKRGGIIEAVMREATSPCVFGEIHANGQWVVLGSCRKMEVGNYVNNLAVYPASELTQTQFEQCKTITAQLYRQGICGFVSVQLLSYISDAQGRKQRQFEFIGVECHLTSYSSAQFLINWLLSGSVHNNILYGENNTCHNVLYCPFVDNNGFKCQQIREFFMRCQQANIVYDPQASEGTVLLPLGNNTSQVLSVFCFAQEQRKLFRMMADCLSGLNSMGVKCTQFDKEDNTKGGSDNYYLLDALWKVRETNRQLSSS